MATSADTRAVIAAAEQAAAAGDYALAERHLRDAAALQEAEWGPVHPDLANTLNNLGVACERAGRLDDAEAAYRRAYEIAVRALTPGDPLVARSADNLRDFCAARGIPFDLPVPREPPPTVAPTATAPEPALASTSAPARRSSAIPALVLLLAAVAGLWWWFGRAIPRTEDSVVVSPPPTAVVPPSPPADVVETPPAAPAPPAVPTGDNDMVVTASVCATFSTRGQDWSCEPIGASVPAGRSLVFYTRLRSARPTTIEHLWFDGGTLRQRVELAIAANPGAGYRTYSRATVTPGEWRVELREDGIMLRDVSFSVR